MASRYWIFLAFLLFSPVGAQAQTLVLGVYPFLSASQMMDLQRPLKDLLSRNLQRPVEMVSAPDFPSFVDRTKQGDYDVILTAPHMGRLAQQRDGWIPLVQSGYQMEIILAVPAKSNLYHLAQMRGLRIAVGAVDSLIFQVISEELARHEIHVDHDMTILETRSFSNVVLALERGEADVIATSRRLLEFNTAEQRASLREIFVSVPMPGFLVMAHPRLAEAERDRLRSALLSYKNTPEGVDYFTRNRLIDFRLVDPKSMARVEPYSLRLSHPKP